MACNNSYNRGSNNSNGDKDSGVRIKYTRWDSVVVKMFQDKPYIHIWKRDKCISLDANAFRSLLNEANAILEVVDDLELVRAEMTAMASKRQRMENGTDPNLSVTVRQHGRQVIVTPSNPQLPTPQAVQQPIQQMVAAHPIQQPVQQMVTAQPVQQMVAAQPVQQMVTAQPVQQMTSPQPTPVPQPVQQVLAPVTIPQAFAPQTAEQVLTPLSVPQPITQRDVQQSTLRNVQQSTPRNVQQPAS